MAMDKIDMLLIGGVVVGGILIWRAMKAKPAQAAVRTQTAPAPSASFPIDQARAAARSRGDNYFAMKDAQGRESCFETKTGKLVELTACLKEGAPGLLEGVGGSLANDGLGIFGGG